MCVAVGIVASGKKCQQTANVSIIQKRTECIGSAQHALFIKYYGVVLVLNCHYPLGTLLRAIYAAHCKLPTDARAIARFRIHSESAFVVNGLLFTATHSIVNYRHHCAAQ